MYLDERSNSLLEELLKNPTVTNKKLQEKFLITRRQVDYSFKKINEWLKEQGKNPVLKVNGQYRFDDGILSTIESSQVETYIPSEKERAYIIILIILLRKEELSLNHLIEELEVSKNTILQDLKMVRKILAPFELRVQYTRSQGYYFEGNEWNKRSSMLFVIQSIIKKFGGELFLQKFMKINEDEINQTKKQINKIEEQLNLNFIDTDVRMLPYSLEGIFARIFAGKHITTDFLIDYSELSDTREYEATKLLISDRAQNIITKEERLYITLQLLTSKVMSNETLNSKEIPKLKKALSECLVQFEEKSLVFLTDKETLVEKLFIHFKPAYYRIKYKLTTDYGLVEKIGKEFELLHYFVGESIDPLRAYLKSEIPDNEIMFITLFIGGHIIDNQEVINKSSELKAIVVCPNGLSISKLMEKNLYNLFPEIYFYPAMSIREFEQTNLIYNLVFSATPLETTEQLFIVNQVMTLEEKKELRRRVMNTVCFKKNIGFSLSNLMEIISQHADIKDENGLTKSLEIFLPTEGSQADMKERPPIPNVEIQLDKLLTEEMIQKVETVSNWHEAIEYAARPLLEKSKIEPNYINEMKRQYPTIPEYILLQKNIAIPHAEIEAGVNELGMSMLYIEKGLPNLDGTLLHFIVVIAAVDKTTHFSSLLQLMELAGTTTVLERIKKAGNVSEIYNIIVDFIYEENKKN